MSAMPSPAAASSGKEEKKEEKKYAGDKRSREAEESDEEYERYMDAQFHLRENRKHYKGLRAFRRRARALYGHLTVKRTGRLFLALNALAEEGADDATAKIVAEFNKLTKTHHLAGMYEKFEGVTLRELAVPFVSYLMHDTDMYISVLEDMYFKGLSFSSTLLAEAIGLVPSDGNSCQTRDGLAEALVRMNAVPTSAMIQYMADIIGDRREYGKFGSPDKGKEDDRETEILKDRLVFLLRNLTEEEMELVGPMTWAYSVDHPCYPIFVRAIAQGLDMSHLSNRGVKAALSTRETRMDWFQLRVTRYDAHFLGNAPYKVDTLVYKDGILAKEIDRCIRKTSAGLTELGLPGVIVKLIMQWTIFRHDLYDRTPDAMVRYTCVSPWQRTALTAEVDEITADEVTRRGQAADAEKLIVLCQGGRKMVPALSDSEPRLA
jgi:hypothetical protein